MITLLFQINIADSEMEVHEFETSVSHSPLVVAARVYPVTYVPETQAISLSWSIATHPPHFAIEIDGSTSALLAANATTEHFADILSTQLNGDFFVERKDNSTSMANGVVW